MHSLDLSSEKDGVDPVTNKKVKDRVLGAVSLLISIWVIYMSMQLPETRYEGDHGPRMFPLMGAAILALCGIGLLVAPEKGTGQFMTKAQWIAAGKMFLAYVVLIALLYFFGFIVAVPVMLVVITFMLSKLSVKNASTKKRLLISLIFGLVCGAALYLIYVLALDAKMPGGVFWNLFK